VHETGFAGTGGETETRASSGADVRLLNHPNRSRSEQRPRAFRIRSRSLRRGSETGTPSPGAPARARLVRDRRLRLPVGHGPVSTGPGARRARRTSGRRAPRRTGRFRFLLPFPVSPVSPSIACHVAKPRPRFRGKVDPRIRRPPRTSGPNTLRRVAQPVDSPPPPQQIHPSRPGARAPVAAPWRGPTPALTHYRTHALCRSRTSRTTCAS
jgi:hypothetical protein